jgi:ADP-heptose:LPS heptosyltransferase
MRNILIFSLKFLGDVIVATPALQALRHAHPDARITVALRSGYEEVLQGNPAVNEILPVDLRQVNTGTAWRKLVALMRLVRDIRSRRFDTVVLLEPGDRETLLAWLSGAARRIGPDYQSFAWMLTTRVDIREDSMDYRSYYLTIARAAVGNGERDDTLIVVGHGDAAWAADVLREVKPGGKILGIHPGSRDENRRWPAERFAAVIDALVPLRFEACVVMAGPGEGDRAREIVRYAKTPCISATDLSIKQTAALMARCNVCITCDSAPRHIAVAVGARTVSLLPGTHRITWRIYDERFHGVAYGDIGDAMLVERVTVEEIVHLVERVSG